MTDEPIHKLAIQVLHLINTLVRNMRMYPSGSPLIDSSLQKTLETFESLLQTVDPFIVAESEKSLLVCGEALSESDQQRPQAQAFLDLMLDLGIRTLTFRSGIRIGEIFDLAAILKETPEQIKSAGGLDHLWKACNPTHIHLDKKIYVVQNRHHSVFAGLALSNQELVKELVGDTPLAPGDIEGLRQQAKDPSWVKEVFQAGLRQIDAQRGLVSTDELSKALGYFILRLDSLVEEDIKEYLSKELRGPLEQIDEEILWRASQLDFPGKLGKTLSEAIGRMLEGKPLGRPLGTPSEGPAEMQRDRRAAAGEKPPAAPGSDDFFRKYRSPRFKHGFQSIIQGRPLALKDPEVTGLLPEVVSRLYRKGKRQEANFILDRLMLGACSKSAEIRSGASRTLLETGEILAKEDRSEDFDQLSSRLISWIQNERNVTPAFQQACRLLQTRVASALEEKDYSECIRIIDAFTGLAGEGAPELQERSAYVASALQELMNEGLAQRVAKGFRDGDGQLRQKAGDCLVSLGPAAAEPLLSLLIESENIDERFRTIRRLSEIGPPLAAIVAKRIADGGPWYYIRNLVMILAKVGDETQVECLLPLVTAKDRRVQREALYAIYQIGGKGRGDTLLSFLSKGDAQLKMDTVELLGALRYPRAVGPLLEILASRSLGWSKNGLELREKICHALGLIGSREAVPSLIKLSGQKGLLTVSAQHERVRSAAEKALAAIADATATL